MLRKLIVDRLTDIKNETCSQFIHFRFKNKSILCNYIRYSSRVIKVMSFFFFFYYLCLIFRYFFFAGCNILTTCTMADVNVRKIHFSVCFQFNVTFFDIFYLNLVV